MSTQARRGPAAANTKGVALVNVRAFVLERGGPDAWTEILSRFTAADRDVLDHAMAVGWYDLGLYTQLLHAADDVLGAGDLATMDPLGRFQAERDLHTIHRVFLRFANPSYAVEKTAELWRRYHDTGTWYVERFGPSEVEASLFDWGVVDRALCAVMTAYVGRLLELVGARSLRVDHERCRARGDDRCVLRARWA